MTAVFGLGNPPSYNGTRHNIGREISLNLKAGLKKKRTGEFYDLFGMGKRCLIMGRTYMNESGLAFGDAVYSSGLSIGDILVICDDINIPLGKIRYRVSGSSGGHKGLKSIIECMGTRNFPRLRVGIGKPDASDIDVKDWVLGKFQKDEIQVIKNVVPAAEEFVMEHWAGKWPDENFSVYI
ncbi:MAG: aminoacyl-tRNA hydrolase [bacterium]